MNNIFKVTIILLITIIVMLFMEINRLNKGDINLDGIIDNQDHAIMLYNWEGKEIKPLPSLNMKR